VGPLLLKGLSVKLLTRGLKFILLEIVCFSSVVFCQTNINLPISPYLIGQNVWQAPSDGIWAKVKECGLGSIRIGGIGYNDNLPSRPTLMDWVKRIKAMGAEPIMQVPHSWSAEQATSLVRYFNVETGVRIKFWSIGNEPNLHGAVSVQNVSAYYKKLAPAMRDGDSSITIFGPECAWYDEAYYKPLIGGALDISGRDTEGRFYIDGVTFHKYPYADQYSRAISVAKAAEGLRENVKSLLALMAIAEAKNGRVGPHLLSWGLTEFNISFKNPQPNGIDGYGVHSFHNGQFFAEVFGIGMEYGATAMNTWSIYESGGSRNATDLGFLDGGAQTPRSTYYHMQLLGKFFKGEFSKVTSNLKDVRAIGAAYPEGFSVMILNMEETGSRDYVVNLEATAPGPDRPAKLDLHTGVTGMFTGNLPAQTTEVLLFSKNGTWIKTTRYGIADAKINMAPSVSVQASFSPIARNRQGLKVFGESDWVRLWAKDQGWKIVDPLGRFTWQGENLRN
jgi:hypothetical protein